MFPSLETSLLAEYTGFGGFFCILWGVGILFVRNRFIRHIMLSVSLIAVGTLLLYAWFIQTSLAKEASNLLLLHLPAVFALGPSLYYFCLLGVNPDETNLRRLRLSFLPAAVALVYALVEYLFFGPVKINLLEGYLQGKPPSSLDALLFLGFSGNVAYYIFFLVKNSYLWKEGMFSDRYTFFFFLLIFLSAILASLALMTGPTRDIRFLTGTAFAIAVFLSVIFIIHHRYPEFFQVLEITAREKKYTKSLLTGVDKNSVLGELKNLMENERIFLEEDLTLPELAKEVGLSAHQLSEFLNVNLQKNFYTYVNEYRVAEAKRLLLEQEGESILTIAYMSGFASKSTFNSVFLKLTGTTPSHFRKSVNSETA